MMVWTRIVRRGSSSCLFQTSSRSCPASITSMDDNTASLRFFGSVKRNEKKTKGDTTVRSRDLDVILAALDAPKVKPPSGNAEEKTRRDEIRKAYTIGQFRDHNDDNHDLTCKIKMKQHAMDMLPKNSKLKERALEIDTTSPPRWRRIPAWTPPIPGFDPSRFTLTEE